MNSNKQLCSLFLPHWPFTDYIAQVFKIIIVAAYSCPFSKIGLQHIYIVPRFCY